MLTPLLCTFALASAQQELKPLSEERQVEGPEPVALEFCRVEAPEVGAIGWTKTAVQRGQVDGEVRYVVHRVAELLDFEALGITVLESRGIYDGDLKLIREARSKHPLGEDGQSFELEWGDEGFRWREGRGRWNANADGSRPTADSDIAIFVHGLGLATPWDGRVFDDATKELQAMTVQPGKESEVEGSTVTTFVVDGPMPSHHRVREDGVYLDSRFGDVRAIGVLDEKDQDTELSLRQATADNPAFESVMATRIPAAWAEKRGTYSNGALGMRLELPKGWERAPAREVGGTHFHAFSEDANAYVSFAVTVLGTGYTLEGWGEGIVEIYAETAVDGEVRTKKQSFAGHDAIRFDFVLAGDATLDSTAYAWERNGLGFLVIGGTWSDAPKKLHRETRSVLKSIKFAR